jgi:hypothetical protein
VVEPLLELALATSKMPVLAAARSTTVRMPLEIKTQRLRAMPDSVVVSTFQSDYEANQSSQRIHGFVSAGSQGDRL